MLAFKRLHQQPGEAPYLKPTPNPMPVSHRLQRRKTTRRGRRIHLKESMSLRHAPTTSRVSMDASPVYSPPQRRTAPVPIAYGPE